MLLTSKYRNPYYYLFSGIILIAVMYYMISINPVDIIQTFFLIFGFSFVIIGLVMLVYKQSKKKLKDNA